MVNQRNRILTGFFPFNVPTSYAITASDGSSLPLMFSRGAFTECLTRRCDTVLSLEHDKTYKMAFRSDGALRIEETPSGVRFEADLLPYPDSTVACRVLRAVAAGTTLGCSPLVRYNLADCSIVTSPQYGQVRRVDRVGELIDISLTEAASFVGAYVALAAAPSDDIRATRRRLGRESYRGIGTPQERLHAAVSLELLEAERELRCYR